MRQRVTRKGRPPIRNQFQIMKTEHQFKSEDSAREVSKLLNAWGSRRNNGNTIAFREGSKVILRPEFTSKDTSRELSYLSESFE